MKPWKKLSQNILLTHSRLSVYEDEVELPSGHKTHYIHFGKKQDATSIIAINDEGKILVQKELSYPINEWLYQFPGGVDEEGESNEDSALRELGEEGGYTGKLEKIGKFLVDHRRREDFIYVYVATDLKETSTHWDLEEAFESYWFTPDEIELMICSGEIVNNTLLCAWALFRSSNIYPDKK